MDGATQWEPGDVFAGRYEIRQPLGEGDRKRTYLAADQKFGRLIALSVIKPEAALDDPEGTEREAKVLGRIGSHDNIVSIYEYDIGAGDAVQYMVFEYLSGGTLAEYLAKAGPLPLDKLLRLGRQLCRGLAHLHSREIIHRDVSPENVWLDERGVAHLGDFDSAITASDTDDLRPITTGSFAAREEHEGWSLDARSDLFSLGGILYVAATGERRPGGLALLRSRRPELPSGFVDLVASLLAESPADRPRDAESVLQRLDEVRHASNAGALLAAGESENVEFKSSLYHPYGPLSQDLQARLDMGKVTAAQAQKEVQKGIKTAVTKTIAAFLNTSGGTLLVGADDSGAVLGIEADFPYLSQGKQTCDGWLLALRAIVSNALDPEVWGVIHASLVQHGQKTLAVIHCPPRASETWHHDDKTERFYIRTSSATDELTGPSLVKYVRERWPA